MDSQGFDLIYSVDVFEHIPEAHMPFEAAFDRLRPGGFLLVKMPAKDQLTIFPERFFQAHQQWLEEEHVGQVYELTDLERRMRKAGFEIELAYYEDGYWARLAWEINYLARKVTPLLQLVSLPFTKWLVRLDGGKKSKPSGNTIQVIGRKPQNTK
jgi:SAM-dependent methyltransferase